MQSPTDEEMSRLIMHWMRQWPDEDDAGHLAEGIHVTRASRMGVSQLMIVVGDCEVDGSDPILRMKGRKMKGIRAVKDVEEKFHSIPARLLLITSIPPPSINVTHHEATRYLGQYLDVEDMNERMDAYVPLRLRMAYWQMSHTGL
jgi:hypothetical protein